MGFSILSLVVTVLSMLFQRKIVRSRDFVSIEFDIAIPRTTNRKRCKNKVKSIQNEIGILLGLEEDLVEVMRPSIIKKGFRICINIYISNAKAIDMSIEREMNDANNKGEIAEIIKTAWNLTSDPLISNINYTKHDSKEREENTVFIQMIKRISKMKLNVSQQKIGMELAMSSSNQIKQPKTTEKAVDGDGTKEEEKKEKIDMLPKIPSIDMEGAKTPGISMENEGSVDQKLETTPGFGEE